MVVVMAGVDQGSRGALCSAPECQSKMRGAEAGLKTETGQKEQPVPSKDHR
jgi:hypothetical protein